MIRGEIFRYLIAGALAFGCDIVVLYVATEFFSLHYLLSNILGHFVGLAVSYYLSVNWVFRYRRYEKRTLVEFSIFTAIVLAGLGLSELLMYFITDLGGVYYLHAKVATSALITVYNYAVKRFVLFRPAAGTVDV